MNKHAKSVQPIFEEIDKIMLSMGMSDTIGKYWKWDLKHHQYSKK